MFVLQVIFLNIIYNWVKALSIILMLPFSEFSRIANSIDHRRVWALNVFNAEQLPKSADPWGSTNPLIHGAQQIRWPMGLNRLGSKCSTCKTFTVQTIAVITGMKLISQKISSMAPSTCFQHHFNCLFQ